MSTIPMPPPPADNTTDQKKSSSMGWKPMLIGNRMRTTSEDSGDSYDAYNMEPDSPSIGESGGRRMSITERFFGSSMKRERSNSLGDSTAVTESKNSSITENPKFKEFMKRQRKILGDDEWQ